MPMSEDEVLYRYARGCIRAYLEGKKTDNWVMSIIRGTGIRDRALLDILSRLETSANPDRYKELLSLCQNRGWL